MLTVWGALNRGVEGRAFPVDKVARGCYLRWARPQRRVRREVRQRS